MWYKKVHIKQIHNLRGAVIYVQTHTHTKYHVAHFILKKKLVNLSCAI